MSMVAGADAGSLDAVAFSLVVALVVRYRNATNTITTTAANTITTNKPAW